MPNTTFQMFAAQYDEGLRVGADAAMRIGLSWTARLLPILLVPTFIVMGVLLALGQLGWGRALSYTTRIAIVLWMAVSMAYVTVVADLINDGIPNEIASLLAGGGTAITAAESFDRLSAQADHFTAQVKAQATGWLTGIPTRTTADLYNGGAQSFLGVLFVVWLIVRIATRVLVATMAFCLLLLIPDSTRGYLMQMAGKILSIVLWTLMTAIVVRILLDGCKLYLDQAIANPGASLDEQLSQLWKIGIWFALCSIIALILPVLAAVGAAPIAGAAQSAAMGAFTMGTGAARGALAGGGRAAGGGIGAGGGSGAAGGGATGGKAALGNSGAAGGAAASTSASKQVVTAGGKP